MNGLRPLAAVLATGLFVSGCTNAIAGEATAPPGVPSSAPTRVHVNFGPQVDPPWTPPARVRELPEIVPPVNGASR